MYKVTNNTFDGYLTIYSTKRVLADSTLLSSKHLTISSKTNNISSKQNYKYRVKVAILVSIALLLTIILSKSYFLGLLNAITFVVAFILYYAFVHKQCKYGRFIIPHQLNMICVLVKHYY